MQITEVSDFGLRSAVVTLRRRETTLAFVLFPMVHMGHPTFYRRVAHRLRECHLVVAEGYDGPSSVGRAYAIAYRLTRQRGGAGLVEQDIDYASLDVPVIWPDRPTAGRRNRLAWWGWLEVVLLMPVLLVTLAVGGRNRLLRGGLEVSDDTEVRLRFLSKIFLQERDEELVTELCRIHDERHDEAIRVAVVYGAGHMPAVVRALHERYGYRPVRGAEWLQVIDL